jgi:hypothetical protein
MPALNTDLLKKSKSLFSTTLSTGIGTGTSDTITPASVAGLPTDTAITITIDRVDSSGVATPAKLERITGVISGGNLTSYVRGVDGTTEQAHSGGAVIEMVWNADDLNDMVDWGLAEHNQDGTHKVVLTAEHNADGTHKSTLVTTLKATGAEITTGSEDAKIVTPKAIADSDIPTAKATATEVATGTDDAKYTTSLAVAPYANSSMSRQSIMNSGMLVAQRGLSFSAPASATFTLDRYKTIFALDGGTAPTLVHTQATLTPGDIQGLYYYYNINTNGAGSGYGNDSYYDVGQTIEGGTRYLCGLDKKVTVSFWAKSDIANKKLGIFCTQRYGTGGTPSAVETITGTKFTLTSTWTLYTHTFTTNTLAGKTFGTANDDYLEFRFRPQYGSTKASEVGDTVAETWIGSGNISFTGLQLCAGDVALPFQPKSFNQELQDCMRYYETSYSYGVTVPTGSNGLYTVLTPPSSTFATIANGQRYGYITYKVKKRTDATPVVYPYTTPTNTSRVSNNGGTDQAANSGVPINSSMMGFCVYNNSAGNLTGISNNEIIFHWSVDAEL